MSAQIPGVDFVRTRVSAALWPLDSVTRRRGEAQLEVRIRPRLRDAVLNDSGFHVLNDLPDGTYRLTVEGAGRDAGRYLPATVDLTTPLSGPDAPVVHVTLFPSPDYRFAPGATVIRGAVTGPGGTPLGGAAISVRTDLLDPPHAESASAPNGEFAVAVELAESPSHLWVTASKGSGSDTHFVEVFEGTTVRAGVLELPVI